jgi:ankyrin repeat protein
MKILIEKGASVNDEDNNRMTPLMYAARKGREEAVKTLLASGANVSARDNEGRTARMHAEEQEYPEVAELLRQYE